MQVTLLVNDEFKKIEAEDVIINVFTTGFKVKNAVFDSEFDFLKNDTVETGKVKVYVNGYEFDIESFRDSEVDKDMTIITLKPTVHVLNITIPLVSSTPRTYIGKWLSLLYTVNYEVYSDEKLKRFIDTTNTLIRYTTEFKNEEVYMLKTRIDDDDIMLDQDIVLKKIYSLLGKGLSKKNDLLGLSSALQGIYEERTEDND